jgi:hypothetical protein
VLDRAAVDLRQLLLLLLVHAAPIAATAATSFANTCCTTCSSTSNRSPLLPPLLLLVLAAAKAASQVALQLAQSLVLQLLPAGEALAVYALQQCCCLEAEAAGGLQQVDHGALNHVARRPRLASTRHLQHNSNSSSGSMEQQGMKQQMVQADGHQLLGGVPAACHEKRN